MESLGCFITATGTWLGHSQLHPRDLPALTVLLQQPSGKLTCKNHYHHYGKREGRDAWWLLSHFRSFSFGNDCIPPGPQHLAGSVNAVFLPWFLPAEDDICHSTFANESLASLICPPKPGHTSKAAHPQCLFTRPSQVNSPTRTPPTELVIRGPI